MLISQFTCGVCPHGTQVLDETEGLDHRDKDKMRSLLVYSLAPLVLGQASGASHVERDLAQTIWNDIVHAVDCTGCQVRSVGIVYAFVN
jgi:hypothetical protein